MFYLIEEPCAENNLDEIVNDERSAKLKSRSVLHKGRSPNFNNHDIAKADEKSRERWTHEKPIFHSWICLLHFENKNKNNFFKDTKK